MFLPELPLQFEPATDFAGCLESAYETLQGIKDSDSKKSLARIYANLAMISSTVGYLMNDLSAVPHYERLYWQMNEGEGPTRDQLCNSFALCDDLKKYALQLLKSAMRFCELDLQEQNTTGVSSVSMEKHIAHATHYNVCADERSRSLSSPIDADLDVSRSAFISKAKQLHSLNPTGPLHMDLGIFATIRFDSDPEQIEKLLDLAQKFDLGEIREYRAHIRSLCSARRSLFVPKDEVIESDVPVIKIASSNYCTLEEWMDSISIREQSKTQL